VFLSATNLHKTYRLGRVDVPVLRGLDLAVEKGEWVAVAGASGSGKSTLLHLLGGLDRPDRGSGSSIEFNGRELGRFSAREFNRYRSRSVGFVFQFYHLLPELTVMENVLIAAMVRDRLGYLRRRGEARRQARELLDLFGLSERLGHRPAELSGGERQRVAIARALVNRPDVLLADEPTGNLDRKTGSAILDQIALAQETTGQTIVMVTHDAEVAARAMRRVGLVDGRLAPESGEAEGSARAPAAD